MPHSPFTNRYRSSFLTSQTQRLQNGSLAAVDVPLKHLLKHGFSVLLDGVTMAGDDSDKIPRVDPLYALVERGAVPAADGVPEQALLAFALDGLGADEGAGEEAGLGPVGLGHARVLLLGGEVEEEVGLDEDLVGLVEEDDLLVGVAVDVLDLEVGLELVADRGGALGLGLVDDGEVLLADLLVGGGLALLREAVGADDLGGREGLLPVRDEDVVLHVGGDEVLHVPAEALELRLHLGGEGDGREHGEGAGGETDWELC